jgi:hypothetical protein
VGNGWLIYFDAYGEKRYSAMRTKDFKTFTNINNEIDVPEGHKHGTIFKAPGKTLKKLKKEIAVK